MRRDRLELGKLLEQRRQLRFAAVEDEAGVLALAPEQPRALERHARALVAAHGVDRDTDGVAHRRSSSPREAAKITNRLTRASPAAGLSPCPLAS